MVVAASSRGLRVYRNRGYGESSHSKSFEDNNEVNKNENTIKVC